MVVLNVSKIKKSCSSFIARVNSSSKSFPVIICVLLTLLAIGFPDGPYSLISQVKIKQIKEKSKSAQLKEILLPISRLTRSLSIDVCTEKFLRSVYQSNAATNKIISGLNLFQQRIKNSSNDSQALALQVLVGGNFYNNKVCLLPLSVGVAPETSKNLSSDQLLVVSLDPDSLLCSNSRSYISTDSGSIKYYELSKTIISYSKYIQDNKIVSVLKHKLSLLKSSKQKLSSKKKDSILKTEKEIRKVRVAITYADLLVKKGTLLASFFDSICEQSLVSNVPTATPTDDQVTIIEQTPQVTITSTIEMSTATPAIATATATPTATPLPTETGTIPPTAISTATITVTKVPTQTATGTTTPIIEPTLAATAISTPTSTNTATAVPTVMATQTLVPTASNTATKSPTATQTETSTNTATAVPTATTTKTATATNTATKAPTLTATQTETPTNTATAVPTATTTKTATATNTATKTRTPTATQTETPTNTRIVVPTATATNTATATTTPIKTPMPTQVPTSIPTATPGSYSPPSPVKIMPLGDSITRGAADSSPSGNIPGGYRKQLGFRLGSSGFAYDFVGDQSNNPAPGIDPNHNGIGGYRTSEIITYYDSFLKPDPDIILLHIGTNDLIQNVPITTAIKNLDTLIDRMTSPPSRRLYVSTIIPIETDIGHTPAEWAVLVDEYNAKVRLLVQKYANLNRKVFLVEMNANIVHTDPNNSLNDFFQPGDYVHPGQAGYTQMGNIWFNALQSVETFPLPITGTSLLTNGSFESDFSGWTTTGNQEIANVDFGTEGSKFVAFNASNQISNGSLSQTFSTTIGSNYTLSFDTAVIKFNDTSQVLEATVSGGSSLLNKTITLSGIEDGSVHWVRYSLNFTADSDSSMVKFRDLSPTTYSVDLLLDNVRVTLN